MIRTNIRSDLFLFNSAHQIPGTNLGAINPPTKLKT
ncbi:Uncharacterised protein [Mycoplasmoides gallisepticum]|uniref:Uncharacterized protein n=1 Tax=Mycoplasmoides gallisepticum TaxID=2096 RepID=A0A3B0PSW2_MYCGL|nr:Uncharacterised protein [Mycoplasmoides gallisepticum]